MEAQREMPQYQCHKKVWALKIRTVSTDHSILFFEDQDYSSLRVGIEYMAKHKPVAGGYYVLYEDGYKSFSPAKAFEEGYTKCSGS